MKRLFLYILMVLMGLIFIGRMEASAQKKMKKETILQSAEDIKWEQIKGAPSGAMTATLWGDQNKGAYGAVTKFPPGYKAPLHYHTNDIKIVVIKGAYIFNGKNYGPGSYVFIPGGNKHVSGGADDSETIFFIEQPGKFDLKPVEAQTKKK